MRITLSALSLVIAGGIAMWGIPSQAQGGGVTYRPAGEKTYNDGGVTVHRHADGSVEVGDGPSAPEPLYPSQRQSARRAVKKKAVAHKAAAAKATTVAVAKKHK